MQNTATSLLTAAVMALILHLAGCSKGTPENDETGAKAPETARSSSDTDLYAEIETNRGTFKIRLRPDLAPLGTVNFVNLVRRGFYHGLEVNAANRTSASFGLGSTVPIFTVQSEYSPKLTFDRPGIVAWTFLDTKKGTTNQISHPTRFFVTKAPNDKWTFQYSAFAEVTEGQDQVGQAQPGDWIRSIRIIGDPEPLMQKHADLIRKWNVALRLAGQYAPGEMDELNKDIAPPFVNSN